MTRRAVTLDALLAGASASVRARNAARRPTGAPDAAAPRTAPPDASAVHHRRSTPAAGVVVVEVPGLRLVSEANRASHEHWRKRSSRAAAQHARMAVALAGVRRPALPLRVCVTSFGPGTKDGDNNEGSAKYVRDAIARWLRVDDADPRVLWRVVQQKGPVGVRVTLAPVDGRGSVVAEDVADVVRLRLTRTDVVRALSDALNEGRARVECGGVVVELTTEDGR